MSNEAPINTNEEPLLPGFEEASQTKNTPTEVPVEKKQPGPLMRMYLEKCEDINTEKELKEANDKLLAARLEDEKDKASKAIAAKNVVPQKTISETDSISQKGEPQTGGWLADWERKHDEN